MNADELYGLALDEFVARRAALAKALRAEGRREEAADAATLRKPSVAGWAVNQLVRTQGRAVEELFDAGDTLRAAQEDLLAGRGDGPALRSANERERTAVEGLVQTARGLLTSDGHELSPAIVERVSDTLHAAALDENARDQVREGRLERELRHIGMGLGEAAAAPTPAPRTSSQAKTKAPAKPAAGKKAATGSRAKAAPRDPAARERAQAARADAKRAEAERAAARKAARVAEAQARRRADRAASALRAAEERRERASEALAAAEDALAAAREEAEAATEAHRQAKASLDSD